MKKVVDYFRIVLFGLGCFAIIQSCKDDDTEMVFPDVPSVRVSKQVEKVKELLKSSAYGWKTIYFPDNTRLGGFTFLFRFGDNQVTMTSDLREGDQLSSLKPKKGIVGYARAYPDARTISEYNVIQGSTVKLSFSTASKINELTYSDAGFTNYLYGKGHKGSIEFLYYGQDGEDLIFRSSRGFTELRFKKAAADDWKNVSKDRGKYKSKLMAENQKMIDNIYNMTKNFDRDHNKVLIFKFGNKTYRVHFISYHGFLRLFNINSEKYSGKYRYMKFGIGFTPTGIVISPPIDVDGNKIDTFTYDENNKQFVAKDDRGVEKASMYYSDNLAEVNEPYSFGEQNDILYFNNSGNVIPHITSSDKFNNFFDKWAHDFRNKTGKKFFYISMNHLKDKDKTFLEIPIGELSDVDYLSAKGKEFANIYFTYNLTKEAKTGKTIVKFIQGKTEDLGYTKELKPLLDFIFRDSGFYVSTLAYFHSPSETRGSNIPDVVGFVPVGNPEIIVGMRAIGSGKATLFGGRP